MTVAEIILRIRSIFNETGTTSGFLSDADNIKKYIDSSQNQIIDRLLSLQKGLQKTLPFFEIEALKILITLNTFNIDIAVDTYLFADLAIEDYKQVYDLQADLNNSNLKKGCTYRNSSEMKWNALNTYQSASFAYPYYTVETSSKIIVAPTPTANKTNGADFRYYKQPAEVTGSTELTLTSECHEAILYLAVSLAFDQDKETALATKYYSLFEKQFATIS